jgi:hypothetical protein
MGYHRKPLIGGGQDSAFIDSSEELGYAIANIAFPTEGDTLWLTTDVYSGDYVSNLHGSA